MTGPTIQITESDRMSHAVVRSSCRGVTYATVVLKATFEWVQNGPARLVDPEPVVFWEMPSSPDPRSSLAKAAEVAPYLSHAAVLLSGFAYAPARAAEGAQFSVRLGVFGSRGALIDKYVRVQACNHAVPLVYEEALATQENPAGSARPSIVHPARYTEAAGFGPIAAAWFPRTSLLRGAKPPELTREDVLDLGYGIDPRYFNPAPVDQQTAFLEGTETLLLEGVDRQLACTSTKLGGVWIEAVQRALVAGASPGSATTAALKPALDMVIIDADKRRFSLVWRAMNALVPETASVVVEAKLHAPNVSPGLRSSAHSRVSTPNPKLVTTLQSIDVPVAPALPFAAAASQSPNAASERVAVDGGPKRSVGSTTMGSFAAPSAPVMPFQFAPHENTPRDFPVIPATPYDPAFVPRAVEPASEATTTGELRVPSTNNEDAAPETRPTRELSQPPTEAASVGLGGARGLPQLLRAPAPPEVVPAHDFARAPSTPPPPAVVAPPLLRAPEVVPEAAAAPLAPPPPPPIEAAPLDDRGDARRASLLMRLREGGAPRDMDLAGADLSDLDLAGKSFSGSNLDGADLSRSVLRGANLAGLSLVQAKLVKARLDEADLTRTNLAGANLEEASLRGATLISADLSKARTVGADFSGAKLVEANLVQIDAERAVLKDADLSRVNAERGAFTQAVLEGVSASEGNFQATSLVGTRFSRAKLVNAKLGKASLDDASFAEADLTGADLSRSSAPSASFKGCALDGGSLKQGSFAKADFSNAKLARASLGRGIFNEASFDAADLAGVDAREARFLRASFAKANLAGADLRDADFTGATLAGATKTDAKLKGAKLPPGEG